MYTTQTINPEIPYSNSVVVTGYNNDPIWWILCAVFISSIMFISIFGCIICRASSNRKYSSRGNGEGLGTYESGSTYGDWGIGQNDESNNNSNNGGNSGQQSGHCSGRNSTNHHGSHSHGNHGGFFGHDFGAHISSHHSGYSSHDYSSPPSYDAGYSSGGGGGGDGGFSTSY